MKKQFLSDSGLTELIGYIKTYITSKITWGNVTGKPTTFPPENHSHDDRYFTETEINTKLAGKANSSHKHTKAEITDFPTSMPASDVPTWAKQASKPAYTKSEVGLGSVDNTADSQKSVKYATSAGSASSASSATTAGTCTGNSATATSVLDYGNTSAKINIGYNGSGISGDGIKYLAGYTTGTNGATANIKDVSKDALKSWLGLGSLAYSSATIPTIPSSLPANGGNASTVNGHTVNADVPENAKFTDTTYTVATTSKDGLMSSSDKTNLTSVVNAQATTYFTQDEINDLFS